MKRKLVSLVMAMILISCAPTMWIPIESSPRQPVPLDHVQFLESPPERPHTVLGIITPPTGEYETEAEAVRAMRREAAKRGADAIFIESQTTQGGWSFSVSPFGGGGGSGSDTLFRAKAIAWQ